MYVFRSSFKKKKKPSDLEKNNVPRALILLSFSALRVLLYFHMFLIPVSSLVWIYKIEKESIYKHGLMSAEKSGEKIWSYHIEII